MLFMLINVISKITQKIELYESIQTLGKSTDTYILVL